MLWHVHCLSSGNCFPKMSIDKVLVVTRQSVCAMCLVRDKARWGSFVSYVISGLLKISRSSWFFVDF